MQNIYIKNLSEKVSDEALDLIIGSNQMLINEFCDIWDKEVPKLLVWTKGVKMDKKDWIMNIVDGNPEMVDGAIAYHTQGTDNKIYGYILVSQILKDGGCIVNPKDVLKKDDKPDKIYDYKDQGKFQQINSVASALCHELLETIIDPSCTVLWISNKMDLQKRDIIFCAEVCDMVQENNVVLHYKGVDVHLSDFVYPAWLESSNSWGPFNHRRTLNRPFALDKGGYAIVYTSTSSRTILGAKDNIPTWHKKTSRRMEIRGANQSDKCILM